MIAKFKYNPSLNGDLTTWDAVSVTNMMYGIILGAIIAFNGDLSNSVVSSITDMSNMFKGATIQK